MVIEISGYVNIYIFNEVIFLVDFILFDIKYMDLEMYWKYIGVDNVIILENFVLFCNFGWDFIIWIFLILGVNDIWENMSVIFEKIKDVRNLICVEIFRYYCIVGVKYVMIGEMYYFLFDIGKVL